MRSLLMTIALSTLLAASGMLWLIIICFALAWIGWGMLGFWILSAPGSALSPAFSFLTGLLPRSLVVASVGTASVGSSLGLLALWSMAFWFILFWVIAFIVLRKRTSRRNRITSPQAAGTLRDDARG